MLDICFSHLKLSINVHDASFQHKWLIRLKIIRGLLTLHKLLYKLGIEKESIILNNIVALYDTSIFSLVNRKVL